MRYCEPCDMQSMLRGRGGCYKHTFYGIESHRCMETTPSLACANKCVFCWRYETAAVARYCVCVCVCINCFMFTRLIITPRPTQPGHPLVVGAMSTSQRAVTPCGWAVKAGMVCVLVAGKTVWSTCYTRAISEHFRHGVMTQRYRNSRYFTLLLKCDS